MKAIEAYEEMETIGALQERGGRDSRKLGICPAKKQRSNAEAIGAYLKADTLSPDNIWNNRHLAILLPVKPKLSGCIELL